MYLLTPDTIKGPFAQDWENAEAAQYEKFGLNVVISPDGKKFARMTNSDVSAPKIYLYDFDFKHCLFAKKQRFWIYPLTNLKTVFI